tara:strand:+ start:2824 stop:3096 length:273 start_codon:yes stop_codon:yes gene_type:complete
VALNLIEYFVPVLFTSTKLKILEETFQDVVNKDLKQYESLVNKTVNGVVNLGEVANNARKKSLRATALAVSAVTPHSFSKTKKTKVENEI